MHVLLLSGFGMPTASLRPLASTLTGRGHTVTIAPLGRNTDCGERTIERVLALVDQHQPSVLLGHSRGGQLALVAAMRRPEIARRLVTIGTPWTVGPPGRFGVPQVARLLRAGGDRTARLVRSLGCGSGDCCVAFRRDLQGRPKAHWTVLWSSKDRIAGEDGRPPTRADDAIDLRLGHVAMILTRRGRTAIADQL
jgi:pimeloyl-ACP methyl ester carboxylesterase